MNVFVGNSFSIGASVEKRPFGIQAYSIVPTQQIGFTEAFSFACRRGKMMVSVRDSVSCYIDICNEREILRSWAYIEIYGTYSSIQTSHSFYGVIYIHIYIYIYI